MNCEEIRKLLPAYVDNELEVSETLEVQEHLHDCTDCGYEYTTEGNLREVLASPVLHATPPPQLARRIRARLRQEAHSKHRFSRVISWVAMRPAMALAASLLFAVVGVGSFIAVQRQYETPSHFMSEAINDHIRDNLMPVQLGMMSSNHGRVKSWLEEKLGTAMMVPMLAMESAALEGGRACYLYGRRAGHILYSRNGARISFFVTNGEGVTLPKDEVREYRGVRFHVGQERGYVSVCWKKGGMAYAFVANATDLPPDDIVRLAYSSAFGSHQS